MYASGLCFASMWCQGFVYRSVTGHGCVAVRIGWLWLSLLLPQDPSGLGGTELAQWAGQSPGGRSDRLIGPEGQLGLLDRMGQPKADWYIHICM